MSAAPGSVETVRDGGLGFTSPASMKAVVLGFSSVGAKNVYEEYSDAQSLSDARGEGMAVETAAEILTQGGGPVGFVGMNTSIAAAIGLVVGSFGTPGTNGSITRSGGTTGPAISLTGAPVRAIQGKVEVTTGGTLGTAVFRWTENNGTSYTTGVLTAASVALGTTGVSVTFPAGTYVVGEIYSWTGSITGGTVVPSGVTNLDAHVRVEVNAGGALGVATFRYTFDAYSGDTASERTYSEVLTIPAGGVFVVPALGTTLTFSGTFVAGDAYEFDVQCAAWNATDLSNAWAALTDTVIPWRFAVAVTTIGNGDATAHAVLTASLQAQLTALANTSRYRRGMIAAGQTGNTAAQVVTAQANIVAPRCLVAYGRVRRATVKPRPGFGSPVTHGVDVIASRAASALLSTDLKRTAPGKGTGPLQSVLKLFHDEYKTPTGLDDAKITTLRTYPGDDLVGFYVYQGRLKSGSGSDFKLWPHGLVMDVACETVHSVAVQWIGRGVRTNDASLDGRVKAGSIDERDAVAFETDVNVKLIARLKTPTNAEGFAGHVQDIRFFVDLDHNVAATSTILCTVGIKPLFYTDYIYTTLGYLTQLPALAA
jgi:hypothetical protein